MSSDRGKLGEFLREVIDWDWAEFCLAEHDEKYTGLEATVFSLIRTAASAKLNAIKLAIDRVDGKLETPVKFEYPKVYARFPFAEGRALPPPDRDAPKELLADLDQLNEPAEPENAKLATMSLRETLEKLADSPRKVTPAILAATEAVEQNPKAYMGRTDESVENRAPLVKSVIAANLMKLGQDRNFDAISEIFEQIDGKLVEVFRVLGEDMYLDSYALEAPFDAVKGPDGIWIRENVELQAQWQSKLEQSVGKKVQDKIIKTAKKAGFYVLKLRPGPGVPVGMLDVLLLKEGFWGVVECKAYEDSPFRALQEATLAKFQEWSWGRVAHSGNVDEICEEIKMLA